ncbi:ribonuclease D [Occultella aeris]|uniref:Ribonuclease D n=1 Tax=Occultella aeris TaxID=2761496 RepID=A0A7M4DJU8_9MICO|nr:ribonuclease D [Occultella aeris]VZO37333.1 Ribonuclease D [Occultella aeris]
MSATVRSGDLDRDALAVLLQQDSIAVDTETSGLDWRADRLLLVQIYSEPTGALLVRLGDETPPRLCQLLENEHVTKVFHFAPFDLRFLMAQLPARVDPVACTKAASKLLDPTRSPSAYSLQSLLQRELGVKINKGAVRISDWGSAELSAEQVQYAADDVTHLLQLHEQLERELRTIGRYDLYREVCRYLPVDATLRTQGFPDPLEY